MLLQVFKNSFIWILFLFGFSLYSQVVQEEKIENKPTNSVLDSKYKRKIISVFNEPSGARYFSINPGVQFISSSVDIVGPNGKAVMAEETNSASRNTKLMYDLKTKDWQIGEYWGVFVLNRNVSFLNTRQIISVTPTVENQNGKENVDLQTEVKGTYSMLLPVLYLGKGGNDNFRIGMGFGVGSVNLQGTADFNDGIGLFTNAVIFNSGNTLDNKIDNLGRYSLLTTGNIDGDPYKAYLLSNLSAGNNLELLGAYSLLTGKSSGSIEPISYLMFAAAANGQLNPLEIYALSTLSRGKVDSRTNYAKSYYFFYELPLGPVTWRLGFGGPFYTQNNYTIDISGFEMSLYTPIEI
ncbi:hypothetical protein EHQ43_02770 [Leptospira bouyouniensis]|uniref:Uncharacterized protein n=1 Tax=Leptospira bouyouniensis TaxID=2484911 RepID=A0A7I0IRY5_9LEPT|nr:hypothetical protein EHQ10_09000 [Leptospira bouyouniensis]TGL07989.1 hypothetical protein EHQ43_02770 [Leptospira bouyouniensis]TGM87592.1 hypothetical protein EHQ99_03635 [Leptospira bouyouniensis]